MKRSIAKAAEQDQGHEDDNMEKSDLKGDYQNVATLFFLYLLQGNN